MTIRRNDRLLWGLAAVLTVLAVVLALSGCSMRGAVAVTPTEAEQVEARRAGLTAAAHIEAIGSVASTVGAQAEFINAPVAFQREYNCLLVEAGGTVGPPSPTLTAQCGPVPLREAAPIQVALESLRTATACASVRSTISALDALIVRLVTKLEQSSQPSLRAVGMSLRVTLGLLVSGGVGCSR